MCVIKHRAGFKEHLSVAAYVSEYFWLRILESSPSPQKFLLSWNITKKMSVTKHLLKNVWKTLKNLPINNQYLVVKLRLEAAV